MIVKSLTDTALILNAVNVARRDPFSNCIVYSPDTDVFLLLIYYYIWYLCIHPSELEKVLLWEKKMFEAVWKLLQYANWRNSFKSYSGFSYIYRIRSNRPISRKSTSAWWKVFLKVADEIIHPLALLGNVFFFIHLLSQVQNIPDTKAINDHWPHD